MNILLATDGSPESLAAAAMANRYIAAGVAEKIHLLHIIPNFSSMNFEVSFSNVEGLTSLVQHQGQEILEQTAKILINPPEVEKKIILGDAATIICDYARATQCHLIIMGNRGNSQLKGLLLGSVSMKVLQYAHCPVLIVKK